MVHVTQSRHQELSDTPESWFIFFFVKQSQVTQNVKCFVNYRVKLSGWNNRNSFSFLSTENKSHWVIEEYWKAETASSKPWIRWFYPLGTECRLAASAGEIIQSAEDVNIGFLGITYSQASIQHNWHCSIFSGIEVTSTPEINKRDIEDSERTSERSKAVSFFWIRFHQILTTHLLCKNT